MAKQNFIQNVALPQWLPPHVRTKLKKQDSATLVLFVFSVFVIISALTASPTFSLTLGLIYFAIVNSPAYRQWVRNGGNILQLLNLDAGDAKKRTSGRSAGHTRNQDGHQRDVSTPRRRLSRSPATPSTCPSATNLQSNSPQSDGSNFASESTGSGGSDPASPRRNEPGPNGGLYPQPSRRVERSLAVQLNVTITQCADIAAIMKVVEDSLEDFDLINMVTSTYRLAKLGAGPKVFEDKRMATLLDHLRERLLESETYERGSLSNSLWALAKMRFVVRTENDLILVGRIADMAVQGMNKLQHMELANLSWAFSAIGVTYTRPGERRPKKDKELLFRGMALPLREKLTRFFLEVAKVAPPLLERFRAQELSNIAVAFSRAANGNTLARGNVCNRGNSPLMPAVVFMAALSRECRTRVRDLQPQHLANTAWAFSKTNVLSPSDASSFLLAVASAALAKMNSFKPQEMANLCWAFARTAPMGLHGTDASLGKQMLFGLAEEMLRRDLAGFGPQDFANVAWAFATLDYHTPRLFRAMVPRACARLGEFKSQELSNLLWGFARTRCVPDCHGRLFHAAQDLLLNSSLHHHSPQALVNISYSSVKAGVMLPKLLLRIANDLATRMERNDQLRSQELANMAWSLSKASIENPQDLKRFVHFACRCAAKTLQQFKPQELTIFLWATAKLGFVTDPLFKEARPYLERFWPQLKPEEVSQINWVFRQLDGSAGVPIDLTASPAPSAAPTAATTA